MLLKSNDCWRRRKLWFETFIVARCKYHIVAMDPYLLFTIRYSVKNDPNNMEMEPILNFDFFPTSVFFLVPAPPLGVCGSLGAQQHRYPSHPL